MFHPNWHKMLNQPIPTQFELVGCDGDVIDLDERHVLKNFLGKTAAEAYEMYRSKDGHSYTEDLMWMNVGGLEYYLPPAFQYLQDDRSNGDWEFASFLLSALIIQSGNRELTPQLVLLIRSVVEYVHANLSKFIVEDQSYLSHLGDQIFEIELHLKKRYGGGKQS